MAESVLDLVQEESISLFFLKKIYFYKFKMKNFRAMKLKD